MSRYFVTGAQGFVGRFAVKQLLDAGHHVLGVGRSPRHSDSFTHSLTWAKQSIRAPLPRELPKDIFASERYSYEVVDLLDRNRIRAVVEQFRPDRILHLATGLWGDPPDKLFRCNVEATVNLVDMVGETAISVDRIVLGSTGGLYGLVDSVPIKESTVPVPEHMYSVSKLAAEMAGRVAAKTYNLPIVFARIFNIVGPGQDERHVCGRWMSDLSAMAAKKKPPKLEVGNLTSTRDMIDVRDTAKAVILLCEKGEAGEAYNVGSGVETFISDILQQSLTIAGLKDVVEVTAAAHRKVDLPRHFADIQKLQALGWQPQKSLTDSLHDLYRYYDECVAPLC